MHSFVLRSRTHVLLIVLLGLLVFSNSLMNGFVGDDYLQIINNSSIKSLSNAFIFFTGSTFESGGAERATGLYYRPMMQVFYAIIYSMSGTNPFLYHFVQVLLHIGNTIFLYFFYKKFFNNKLSFVLSLIFLVHPINAETVVYSANLQDTLFFFFGIASLLVLQSKKIDSKKMLLFGLLQLLALLSKETALLFICFSFLYTIFFRKELWKKILGIQISVAAIYLLLWSSVASMYNAPGSIAPIANSSLLVRVINVPAMVTYYLKTVIFPLNISSHHFWINQELNIASFFLPLSIILVLITVFFMSSLYLYGHKKIYFKPYLFFLLWFVAGLTLHLNLIPLDMTVADRWFYFPFVGLIASLAYIWQTFSKHLAKVKSLNLVILALIMALSVRTVIRTFDWRDGLTLYSRDIKTTPSNFVLDNAYATELINDIRFEDAKPYVVRSVGEHPYYANLNNMAIIYTAENNIPEAKKYLQLSLRDSNYYVLYENYSSFLVAFHEYDEAEAFTRRSLKRFPNNGKLWFNLAKVQYISGKKEEALVSAKKSDNLLRTKESADLYSMILRDVLSSSLSN